MRMLNWRALALLLLFFFIMFWKLFSRLRLEKHKAGYDPNSGRRLKTNPVLSRESQSEVIASRTELLFSDFSLQLIIIRLIPANLSHLSCH